MHAQSWKVGTEFPGGGRTQAASFTIDKSTYVLTGFTGGSSAGFHRDLWAYNGTNSQWTKRADLPSSARDGGSAFAIAGKGYFGLGNYYGQFYKDFWQYDPGANTWKELGEFPGEARSGAFVFVIKDKAYVGGGHQSGFILNDLWEYNPRDDRWKLIGLIPRDGRSAASVFVLNNQAYLMGGVVGEDNSISRDVDIFNPSDQSWDYVGVFPGLPRRSATAFSMNELGFFVGGWDRKNFLSDAWRFNPQSQEWQKLDDLPVGLADAVAIAGDSTMLIGTGSSGPLQYHQSIFQYNPDEVDLAARPPSNTRVVEKQEKQKKSKAEKKPEETEEEPNEIKVREGILELPEWSVTAHGRSSSIFRNTSGIGTMSQQEIAQNHPGSLAESLNRMPGISMGERGLGGSRRISIRGNTLRSPFGVRDIKTYWNEIPVTSPDGSSPIELFDPQLTQRIEVIKGPSGTLYGAGNGGVLRFHTAPELEGERGVETQVTAGSYGQVLAFGRVLMGKEKHRLVFTQINNENKGYREHEANEKDQYIIESVSKFSEKSTLSLLGSMYSGSWQLPGAVDSLALFTDPIPAVPYSVAGNAHVNRERLRVGASHKLHLENKFTHVIALYYNTTSKINPYGTSTFFNGYKDEAAKGYGGRTDFTFQGRFIGLSHKLVLGGEFQRENNDLVEHTNNLGAPGTLLLDVSTLTTQSFVFANLETELGSRMMITGGISYNFLSYNHSDNDLTDGFDLSVNHSFEPVLSPRVGLVLNPSRQSSIFANYSKGFSPPTLWEVQQIDGSVNTNLKPEIGTNLEAGFRWLTKSERLLLGFSAYSMQLDNAIISSTLITGQVLFANAGVTDQRGVEASFRLKLVDDTKNDGRTKVVLWSATAINDYTFKNYQISLDDYSGLSIPGVDPLALMAGLEFTFWKDLILSTDLRHVSAVPVNYANTNTSPARTVLNAKLMWEHTSKGNKRVRIFGGVNNWLNESYSSFLQINAQRDKYYNPSPGRNYYAGIGIGLFSKNR